MAKRPKPNNTTKNDIEATSQGVASSLSEGAEKRATIGRPTLYRDEFCDLVVDLGAKGYSLAMMAREIGVIRSTIYRWAEEHEPFCNALERARELSLSWWEEQGQKGVWGGSDFNHGAFKFMACNLFPRDFRERREVEHSGKLSLEQLVAGEEGEQ